MHDSFFGGTRSPTRRQYSVDSSRSATYCIVSPLFFKLVPGFFFQAKIPQSVLSVSPLARLFSPRLYILLKEERRLSLLQLTPSDLADLFDDDDTEHSRSDKASTPTKIDQDDRHRAAAATTAAATTAAAAADAAAAYTTKATHSGETRGGNRDEEDAETIRGGNMGHDRTPPIDRKPEPGMEDDAPAAAAAGEKRGTTFLIENTTNAYPDKVTEPSRMRKKSLSLSLEASAGPDNGEHERTAAIAARDGEAQFLAATAVAAAAAAAGTAAVDNADVESRGLEGGNVEACGGGEGGGFGEPAAVAKRDGEEQPELNGAIKGGVDGKEEAAEEEEGEEEEEEDDHRRLSTSGSRRSRKAKGPGPIVMNASQVRHTGGGWMVRARTRVLRVIVRTVIISDWSGRWIKVRVCRV